jgi:hypothetical protein
MLSPSQRWCKYRSGEQTCHHPLDVGCLKQNLCAVTSLIGSDTNTHRHRATGHDEYRLTANSWINENPSSRSWSTGVKSVYANKTLIILFDFTALAYRFASIIMWNVMSHYSVTNSMKQSPFWKANGSSHKYCVLGHYKSSCFLFKTQRFGDWILSPSSRKSLLSWTQ